MAITIEANYSKKLGLPSYSSHQYSITVKTEVSDLNQINEESERLYHTLQDAVDKEIQQTGFLPGNASHQPHTTNGTEGNPVTQTRSPQARNGSKQDSEVWQCSPKQRELILSIVEQNKLDRYDIEELAATMFDKSVVDLNKLEASGLIETLLERYSKNGHGNRNGRRNGRTSTRRAS